MTLAMELTSRTGRGRPNGDIIRNEQQEILRNLLFLPFYFSFLTRYMLSHPDSFSFASSVCNQRIRNDLIDSICTKKIRPI